MPRDSKHLVGRTLVGEREARREKSQHKHRIHSFSYAHKRKENEDENNRQRNSVYLLVALPMAIEERTTHNAHETIDDNLFVYIYVIRE